MTDAMSVFTSATGRYGGGGGALLHADIAESESTTIQAARMTRAF
jgi:hypothetical protein